MPNLTRGLHLAALLTVYVLAAGRGATGQTAAIGPAVSDEVMKSLAESDAPAANALLDKLSDEQIAGVVAAFDPAMARPDAKAAIVEHLSGLAARVRSAQGKRKVAMDEEWGKRTGPAIYRSSGKHNSAWDKAVLDAFAADTPATAKQSAESARRFKAAMDAGCGDPLVRYYYVRRAQAGKLLSDAEAYAQYLAVLPDLDKSAYSPGRKFHLRIMILRIALASPRDTEMTRVANRMYREAIQLLPTLAEEKPSSLLVAGDAAVMETAAEQIGHRSQADFQAVSVALHKLLPQDGYPYAFDARNFVHWAWDARGGGWADSVSPEQWKLFEERLRQAETAGTTGAALDPLNAECATEMISVAIGLNYERPAMEKWFARAMLANPGNMDACRRKRIYLLPRWHGSAEEEIEFGRECLKTGTVGNRIPIMLVEVHLQNAEDRGNKDAYMAQPKVWSDIEAVYKKFLSDPKTEIAQNNLRLDRANYIKYANMCHQWQKVLDLMDEFKDDVDVQILGGKAVYDFYRKNAMQQLAKAPL